MNPKSGIDHVGYEHSYHTEHLFLVCELGATRTHIYGNLDRPGCLLRRTRLVRTLVDNPRSDRI